MYPAKNVRSEDHVAIVRNKLYTRQIKFSRKYAGDCKLNIKVDI